MKIKNTIGALILIGTVFYMLYSRFSQAELTDAQFLIVNWKLYVFVIIALVIGIFLMKNKKSGE